MNPNKKRKRFNEVGGSSGSEDEERKSGTLNPINFDSSLADINPMVIDKSITWSSIGGLKSHIDSLNEIILLPLLYQNIFQKFNISPPKGVLFYGPPGIITTPLILRYR